MKKTPAIKHSAPPARGTFFGKYMPEIIVFVFVVLLYANSVPNNFNLDDELVTREHKLTSKGISAIPEIFTSPYYTDNAGYSYEYRPVVLTSFAIEHQIFGENPHVSHFFNLLLYALCCVILYRVVYLFLPGRPKLFALSIALFFAAFPVHTEDVCSIKNRDEILSMFFGLLALYAAYKTISTTKTPFLILMVISFVLALLSKTTSVDFVIIIPLVIIFFTAARFREFMVISLLLLVPAMFAIDINFWHKILGSVFLVSGLSILYLFVRTPPAFIAKRAADFKTAVTLKSYGVQTDNGVTGFKGLKILLTDIIPGLEILNYKSMALAVLSGALFIAGVYAVFPVAEIGAILILGALIIWGDVATWWWASVVLYGCLGFVCINYGWNKTLYGELVSAALVYHIFYGNRKLFIPVTVIFIAISAIGFHWTDFHILLNRLVGVVGLRVIGWPAIIWQAIPIHNFFKHHNIFPLDLFSTVDNVKLGGFFFTAIIISLIFKTGARFLVGSFVLLAMVVMLYFQSLFYSPLSLSTAQSELVSTVNHVNPKFIEIKQDRPLDFVEQPVTNLDTRPVRVGTAFEVIDHYFIKTLIPYPMAFYYGYSFIKPESITEARPLAGLIIYFSLLILAIAIARKNKVLSAGLLIYLLSLAIFSGYFYPVPGQIAERFMLIPTMGWCILLGFAFFGALKFNSKSLRGQWVAAPKIARAGFLTMLILYSAITFSRNFDWKDDLTLYRHDISYVDESVQAHNILATHLVDHSLVITDPAEQKELREEAIGHFKKAINLRPTFFNPTYDIGRVYIMLNLPDSALQWFIKANNLNPDYTEIQFNIADIYTQQGQYQAAIPYLEYAINRRPEDYTGYNKLSYVYFRLKEPYKSIEISKQAILKARAGGVPYVAIGSAYIGLNKPDSAAVWAHKALEVEPGNQGAINLLHSINSK